MLELFLLILLPILPNTAGKSTVVIKQVIHNEEVLLNKAYVTAFFDERLEFHCYVNFTFGNSSYIRKGVHWKTPIHVLKDAPITNGSVLIIPRMSWLDKGDYACLAGENLYQRFYLSIDFRDWEYRGSEIPILYKDDDLIRLPNFNFTHIEIPDIYYDVSSYSYTDKGPIFFIPAVIVIILGLLRMCYYFRRRSNASWERLRTGNCRHQLCLHRRRADPTAICLLQSTHTSALSIVIVGAPVNENGIENPMNEGDRPPAYNDVIPQDLPPTYNEAVETSNEVPASENRT